MKSLGLFFYLMLCLITSHPAKKDVREQAMRKSPRNLPRSPAGKLNGHQSPQKSPSRPAGRTCWRRSLRDEYSSSGCCCEQIRLKHFSSDVILHFDRLTIQITSYFSPEAPCGCELLLWQAEDRLSHPT